MFDTIKAKIDLKRDSPPPEHLGLPPPPYNDANLNTTVPVTASHDPADPYKHPRNSQVLQPQPQQYTPGLRFPQTFGIYHAPGSTADLLIAQHNGDPNPIYLITTHGGMSSQPSLVLHSAPYESAPPLATADFHSISSTTDLNLYLANPSAPQSTEMHSEGMTASSYIFRCYVPCTNSMEDFEWKRSSGQEVAMLQSGGHGKKLVRVGTGEVVAAFAKPGGLSRDKKGKMVFLAHDRTALGELFEVYAVVCVAAIIEKERRRQRNARSNRGLGAANGMF